MANSCVIFPKENIFFKGLYWFVYLRFKRVVRLFPSPTDYFAKGTATSCGCLVKLSYRIQLANKLHWFWLPEQCPGHVYCAIVAITFNLSQPQEVRKEKESKAKAKFTTKAVWFGQLEGKQRQLQFDIVCTF